MDHLAESLVPPSPPAIWSPRARGLLTLSIAAGLLAALYGIFLIAEPLPFFGADLFDVFKPVIGVALALVGGVLARQSFRLLQQSGPDRPALFGAPDQARTLFVSAWLVGSTLALMLNARTLVDLLTAGTILGLTMAGFGALWLIRRFCANIDWRWPVGSALARRRPVAWSAFFALMWGVASVVLAFRLELWLVELAAPLIEARMPARLTQADVESILYDPVIVIGLIVGVVVLAPLIEEVSKVAGLWLFRGVIRAHGDGLVLGLAAGLGFGLIESALYILAGILSNVGVILFPFVWMRVATMWMHSLTSGLSGAAYARSRLTGDRRVVWGGVARAALAHGMWNAGVVIFVAMSSPIGSCAYLVLAGYLVGLAIVLSRALAAAIDRAIQDDHALAGVPLPSTWSPLSDGIGWRLAGGRPVSPSAESSGSPHWTSIPAQTDAREDAGAGQPVE